jgi:membrane associated rhomboid family serine protease
MGYDGSPFALTTWVRRLLAVMAAVYLLQVTVFVSPWFEEAFGFTPSRTLVAPWTLLTYAFLHGGFFHFLFNLLVLFMFGPPVEGRLGGGRFIRLFVVSALGGSALSLAFLALAGNATIIGASGAVFGVMLAFVLEWPDAPVLVFPLPVPVKAKWLVVFMAAVAMLSGFMGSSDGVAHFAHLGGFAAAFIYLRGPRWLARSQRSTLERAPAVLVRPPSAEGSRRSESYGPPRRRGADAAVKAEVDRVLDKISARGLGSLTPEERRFLDEISRKFKQTDQ